MQYIFVVFLSRLDVLLIDALTMNYFIFYLREKVYVVRKTRQNFSETTIGFVICKARVN